MKIIGIYSKICSFICKLFDVLTVVGICSSLFVLFAQVIARYLFRYGIVWSDDFSKFTMVWFVMLGAATIVRDNSHIRVTALESMLSANMQKVIGALCNATFIVFAVLVIVCSPSALQIASRSVSSGMELPMQYVFFCFPLTAAAMILHAVLNIIETAISIFGKKSA